MLVRISIFIIVLSIWCNSLWLPIQANAEEERAVFGGRCQIAIIGDSLVAGYGLKEEQSFPAVLERILRKEDQGRLSACDVINMGVSGDTSAGVYARVNHVVESDADVVVIVVGGNDVLRGIMPAVSRSNVNYIVKSLSEANKKVVLAGMIAPKSYGPAYGKQFNSLYPDIAKEHEAMLYPFFLQAALEGPQRLIQVDGLHPNKEGVEAIAKDILPYLLQVLEVSPISLVKPGE